MKDWFRIKPVALRFVCVFEQGHLAGFGEREANLGFCERCCGPKCELRDVSAWSCSCHAMPKAIEAIEKGQGSAFLQTQRATVLRRLVRRPSSCYYAADFNRDVLRLSVSAVVGPYL